MKLLTFLGTTRYWKAAYLWKDRRYETEFIAEAIAGWFNPDTIVVFLTEQAEQHDNWKQLQQRLQGQNVQPVRIPDGKTEPEIWEIFDVVVEQVSQGENILLDVTHAFRSLPMLLTVVAAFLRAIREVRVEHILYAPSRGEGEETVVLDLSLLLHLLDWMEATKRFRETGDARWIGETLVQTHDALRRAERGKPRNLKKAGKELANLAQSLHLGRPLESASTAEKLQSILPQAAGEIRKWAKPFELLLDELKEQTDRLAYRDTKTLDAEHLQKQLDFLHQLLDYGLVMQAAQAAREWVVNWAIWYDRGCASVQKNVWLSPKVRHQIEGDLSNAFACKKTTSRPLEWLDNQKLGDLLKELWPALSDLRNDLAHCGMRLQHRPIKDLMQQTEKYLHMLDDVMQLSSAH